MVYSTVVIEKEKIIKDQYPCLKKQYDSDCIVYFIGPKKGFVVASEYDITIQRYSENWNEGAFVLFNGRVILENAI